MDALLLRLFDKFIELSRQREIERNKRFDKVVQPIFETLQEVHKNYLHVLQSTRETLLSTQSVHAAYENFEAKRLEQQAARHDLIRRCDALLQAPHLEDCRGFLLAVHKYFVGRLVPYQHPMTGSHRFARAIVREAARCRDILDFTHRGMEYKVALSETEQSENDGLPTRQVLLSTPEVVTSITMNIDQEMRGYQEHWKAVADAYADALARNLAT